MPSLLIFPDALMKPPSKLTGQWIYLYRAVDKSGQTIDFMLPYKRDTVFAKKFFRKALRHCHEVPLVINTNQNAACPCAIKELKQGGVPNQELEHRGVKYLNNIIESNHRRIKRRIGPMISLHFFKTANRTLKGIEAMAMMIKQQTYFFKQTIQNQITFIYNLFGIYA